MYVAWRVKKVTISSLSLFHPNFLSTNKHLWSFDETVSWKMANVDPKLLYKGMNKGTCRWMDIRGDGEREDGYMGGWREGGWKEGRNEGLDGLIESETDEWMDG